MALPQAASASSLGFPTWSVTNAFFDTFPAKTFVGDTPDATNTTLFSVTANNTFPATGGAGAVTGSGDRLYNGWAASSVAFDIQHARSRRPRARRRRRRLAQLQPTLNHVDLH